MASESDDEADELLKYFDKTWIDEPRRRGKRFIIIFLYSHLFPGVRRKKPQLDHTLWNVYDHVIADLSRSDISVEGWHNAFATRVTFTYPTIRKPPEKILQEQSKFEVDIAQLLQGHQPKSKKSATENLTRESRM